MAKIEKLKSTIVIGILLSISLISLIITYCFNLPLIINNIQSDTDGSISGNLGAGIGAAIVLIVLIIFIIFLSAFSLVVTIIALPFSIRNIINTTNKIIKRLSISYVVICGLIVIGLIIRIILFSFQIF